MTGPQQVYALTQRRWDRALVRAGTNLDRRECDEYPAWLGADRLAAASEALHVAGWSLDEMRDSLGIKLTPLLDDPLHATISGLPKDVRPWEPWPASLAARLFLERLEFLAEEVREYLAQLGFRTLDEAVGHAELLDWIDGWLSS